MSTELPSGFSVEIEKGDGVQRFVLRGELDLAATPAAQAALLEACARGGRVEVDLSQLDFLDSSGLQTLVSARKEADRNGCSCVVTGVSDAARKVLELTSTLDWLQDRG